MNPSRNNNNVTTINIVNNFFLYTESILETLVTTYALPTKNSIAKVLCKALKSNTGNVTTPIMKKPIHILNLLEVLLNPSKTVNTPIIPRSIMNEYLCEV